MGADFLDPSLDIFLSYTGKDRNLAMRMYDDLARSGFSIWRYERDGNPGADFKREFENSLRKARVFCLIDSEAARQSSYVASEIHLAWDRQQKGELSHFAVCLAEPEGNWRDQIAIPFSTHFIPDLNKLRYFDFSTVAEEDVFDPFDRYRSAIIQLIEYLNGQYTPLLPVPWVKNFEDELYHSNAKISLLERKILLDDYAVFYHFYNLHQYSQAERRLHLIQQDWEELNLISPLLAQGTLLFEQEKTEEAYKVFSRLTRSNAQNPMGWWGLAITQLHLGQSSDSIVSINRAISETIESNPHHRAVLPNLWHYKLHALMQNEDFTEAEKTIQTIPFHFRETPEVRIAMIWLYIFNERWSMAESQFNSLNYLIDTPERNSLAINESLAALALKFAERSVSLNDAHETRYYLELRIKLVPQKIRAWAELAEFYSTQKYLNQEMLSALTKGFNLHPTSAEDNYFYGLLYHCEGNKILAYQYFQKSGLTNWVFYGN